MCSHDIISTMEIPHSPFVPVIADDVVTVFNADCRDVLAALGDDVVDAVITDPPYEIGLVGKKWDKSGIAFDVNMWEEVLRVLKPGGYALVFGATRTWHRLAVALEDAGFEIRDSIAWIYGSGKPAGMDVGRKLPDWSGWHSALKPAHENIVVARKPLYSKTLVENVDKFGVGALHIDACRVGDGSENQGPRSDTEASAHKRYTDVGAMTFANTPGPRGGDARGRFPSNVLLSDEVASVLDEEVPNAGAAGKASGPTLTGPSQSVARGKYAGMGEREPKFYGDNGGPSRFFPTFHYCGKAPKRERPRVDGVVHNSVKPLELMRWLVRLVASEDATMTVLDPFAGSGTTVEACILEDVEVIGVEKESDYIPLIEERVRRSSATR